MSKALQDAGVDTNNLSRAQDKLQSELSETQQKQQNLIDAQNRYGNLMNKISWSNIKGAVLGALGTYEILKAPVKIAGDFEEAMQKVKAVGFSVEGSNMAEFELLRKQALDLGASTKFTSIEAANAQEALIRANFSPQDVLNAMPALLNTAAAENLGIAQASDIIAGVMGGLNMKAIDAPKIADIMAFTSATSKLDIPGLAEGLKSVAPVAATQGIKLDQLSAYIGTLANKNIDMGTISTGLRNILLILANPKTQDSLSKMGVKVKSATGQLVQLPDVFAQLDIALKGKGELDKAGVLGSLFGQQNAAIAFSLMSESSSGGIDAYHQRILKGYEGQAKREADINLDSLNGQLTILSSSWDGLKTTIGDLFKNEFRALVETLSDGLSRLNALMLQFPNISKAVAWGLALIAGTKAAKTIWDISSALFQLPGAWLQVQKATLAANSTIANGAHPVSLIGSAIHALAHPVQALQSLFSATWALAAAHPFGAIALAIGSLVTVGTAVYQNWDSIKELWQSSLNWLSDKCNAIALWWQNFSLPNIFEPLKPFAELAAEFLLLPFNTLLQFLSGFTLPDIFAPLRGYIDNAINYVYDKWKAMVDWVKSLNPFAGGKAPAAPSVSVGGVKHDTGGSKQVENAMRALNGFSTGGIIRSHSIVQVAENGPEAIIPLSDKSRGLPLLFQAAQSLGASDILYHTQQLENSSFEVRNSSSNPNGNNYFSDVSNAPVININISGNNDFDIADKVKQAVLNALQDIQQYNERISFA